MTVVAARLKRGGANPLKQLAELPDAAAIEVVKRGIPAARVRALAEELMLPLEALAAPLQLTGRTLHRRMQEGTLAQPESERLLALARVFFQAAEVLGSKEKAAHWLQSRPSVFAGLSPLECMETWLGIRQIEAVLWRIRDGVYS